MVDMYQEATSRLHMQCQILKDMLCYIIPVEDWKEPLCTDKDELDISLQNTTADSNLFLMLQHLPSGWLLLGYDRVVSFDL